MRHPINAPRRLGLLLASAALTLALLLGPTAVLACSGTASFAERVNRSEVILGGWVESIAYQPEGQALLAELAGAKPARPPNVPVEVRVRVHEVLRGEPDVTFVFVDERSAYPMPAGSIFWAGSGGSCGVLDADPTGQYVLVAFQNFAGQLTTSTGLAVFGASADDAGVARYRGILSEILELR